MGRPGEYEMIYQLIPNLPLNWKKEKKKKTLKLSRVLCEAGRKYFEK